MFTLKISKNLLPRFEGEGEREFSHKKGKQVELVISVHLSSYLAGNKRGSYRLQPVENYESPVVGGKIHVSDD